MTRIIRFIRTPCAPGWWSVPRITDRRAYAVGSDGHATTNRCFRIWISWCGGSRDDAPARRSLTGVTRKEEREDAAGKAKPFPRAGGGAGNNAAVARGRHAAILAVPLPAGSRRYSPNQGSTRWDDMSFVRVHNARAGTTARRRDFHHGINHAFHFFHSRHDYEGAALSRLRRFAFG